MTIRSCGGGHHNYLTAGSRSKCSRCGSVQVDLTANETRDKVDPTKVFASRRPTLFTLKLAREEAVSEVTFGKARHRK